MISQQWVFAAASAALAAALVLGIPLPDRRALHHPAIVGAAVLLVVSLAVLAIFVEPTLIHADVAAPLLVDCVLEFPAPCTNRGASYGQYGFWFLGGLTRVFGGDLGGIFRSMELVATINVVLLATLAYRFSGSPYGALFAVAATATNPIFLRVAASEDMHNVGLFFGLLAFIAMDVFALTRRPGAMVAAVLALGLMFHTRQTFHVFAPCAFLLALARGGRSMLKAPLFWAGGVAVLGVLANRVLASDSASLTEQMFAIIGQPVLLPSILRHHALFDAMRFGPLPLVTVAAIVWASFAGGTPRAVALVFAANFLVTYPCGMPSPGVVLAQRLSTHAIGMLLFAMGGTAFLQSMPAARRTVVAAAAATIVAIAPPFFPGWHTLGEITPIHREYLAVEAAANELPQEFTEIILPMTDSNSFGGARYAGLIERTGRTVHPALLEDAAPSPRPWLFLENIECWTYSFYEVAGEGKRGSTQPEQYRYRWDRVIFGRQPSPVRPTAMARPECQPFLQHGRPIGSRRVITDPPDDPPFLFYASNAVPIQFYELPASFE